MDLRIVPPESVPVREDVRYWSSHHPPVNPEADMGRRTLILVLINPSDQTGHSLHIFKTVNTLGTAQHSSPVRPHRRSVPIAGVLARVVMDTRVGGGAFSRAVCELGEQYEAEVISLADNFGPFEPVPGSEGETEHLEANHGTGDRIGGELPPYSKDGFEFTADASLLECTPPDTGVLDSVLLSDVKHEGTRLVSLDSVFGSLESDMLSESQGAMDNDIEHKTGHPVQDKLAGRAEDEKGGGVATVPQGVRANLEPILLSESEGDDDHHQIGQLVQDESTPRPIKDGKKGEGAATEPYRVGMVKSGKEIRNVGNKHPTRKPKQEPRHQPYASACSKRVTPSDYRTSYRELLRPVGLPECKSMYKKQAQHILGAVLGSAPSVSTATTSTSGQGSNRPPAVSQVLKPYNG